MPGGEPLRARVLEGNSPSYARRFELLHVRALANQ